MQWEKAEWDPVWEYPSGLLKARLSYSSGLPWGDKMKKNHSLCLQRSHNVSSNIDVSK